MNFLRLGIGIVAAVLFVSSGQNMSQLQSVGGQTVAEYFYQAMGMFSYGMAALCLVGSLPRGSSAVRTSGASPVPTPPNASDSALS